MVKVYIVALWKIHYHLTIPQIINLCARLLPQKQFLDGLFFSRYTGVYIKIYFHTLRVCFLRTLIGTPHYLEDLSLCSDDTLEDNSASLCVKQDFLKYLLSLKDIEVKYSTMSIFS
jgi:hypothetical protein